ncbi:MAG TPA: hypothetical protein VGV86_16335 [Acidimicrobiales bacterium]|nr:hypothetical protein [Acidimicrobiales bacterium]
MVLHGVLGHEPTRVSGSVSTHAYASHGTRALRSIRSSVDISGRVRDGKFPGIWDGPRTAILEPEPAAVVRQGLPLQA